MSPLGLSPTSENPSPQPGAGARAPGSVGVEEVSGTGCARSPHQGQGCSYLEIAEPGVWAALWSLLLSFEL